MLAEGLFLSNLMYCIPLSTKEFPAPPDDMDVLHLYFFGRGLGFTLHTYVWGLLFFFGIQLHHLNPYSILHLANFITLCKFFLGAAPHFDHFRRLFFVKGQMSGGSVRDIGGASLQRQPRSTYFPMAFARVMWAWQK